MKPVVIDLFKGHRFLPNFAVMQNTDEYTSPEIEIQIMTSIPNEIPPLHTIYEEISCNSSSIQELLFEQVLPYYYSIVTKKYGIKFAPRIQALVISHCPFNEEKQ